MSMDDIVLHPPFNITRSSHIVLTVADLDASKAFYTDLCGLVVSDADSEAVYLRGMEEAAHHSLVLRKGNDPVCQRVGFRVQTDDDIRAGYDYFQSKGVESSIVEVPYQGLTLHVRDAVGVPLEFTSSMELRPRLMTAYDQYRGASAQRLDHYQLQSAKVRKSYEFYQPLGFRTSEYTFSENEDGSEHLWGVWMQRKGNPHDIVFTHGPGPRLHHFAYTLRDASDMIRACDVAGALGLGQRLERGPGRHGISGAMFIYFRDPDGHRIELFNTHYQHIDIEPAVGWSLSNPKRADQWGLPAQEQWFAEATRFAGAEPSQPDENIPLPTLEKFLARKAAERA
ncbi:MULTISPECIES: 3,4-dihydroxyphenylacetate 2,3-dioxygenase [unclassified Devosia]|uniref:3,4-dihydroxyphenylacetate 2,3-dioxygenase n=1 Tax=unclassified Devosia TaxID=196773 RepID=UPI00145DFC65|nr:MULTISPECIES: 3,4-dihydroxyphenylacetate 2,3-dioxygenase [unclassified Devosia]MBJ6987873.1 3,4-dihydroxyphenylacetate 2,3-dioxygenase [Devosia sp. MC521]QMW63777.1 3,4-dihydroxyphenylacetate 2,3-dioxygenase [Devosia sp. MC521]